MAFGNASYLDLTNSAINGSVGAMGAAGGPFDNSMGVNAGVNLTNPNAMNPLVNRHGSLEQSARANVGNMGDYLNSMSHNGMTPTGTSPRARSARRTPPRARSPLAANDDDDDFEDRRNERRKRRRDRESQDEPVGVGFRLNACETSLRDRTNELAAQRLMINYLSDEMKR